MGLYVTAYANARRTPSHNRNFETCDAAGHVWAFAYSGMEASYRGLANADVLGVFENSEMYVGGACYDVSDSERHGFAAGSYTGYNAWREDLAKAFHGVDPGTIWADATKYADQPFYELITFADNEGCIGPDAARDLLADFEAGQGRWSDYWAARDVRSSLLTWNIERYEDWTQACRLAARDGLIRFG